MVCSIILCELSRRIALSVLTSKLEFFILIELDEIMLIAPCISAFVLIVMFKLSIIVDLHPLTTE